MKYLEPRKEFTKWVNFVAVLSLNTIKYSLQMLENQAKFVHTCGQDYQHSIPQGC